MYERAKLRIVFPPHPGDASPMHGEPEVYLNGTPLKIRALSFRWKAGHLPTLNLDVFPGQFEFGEVAGLTDVSFTTTYDDLEAQPVDTRE